VAGRATKRASVFVGSSSEGLAIAEHLQVLLDDYAEVTIWNQGVFGLTRSALDNLVRSARESDFAVLVLSKDDQISIRGRLSGAPRDNVIFELGLFIGALGPERTFMVHSRQDPPRVPTDLLGVTAALYNERSDQNIQAALGPAALQLRKAVLQLGPVAILGDSQGASTVQAVHRAADLVSAYAAGLAGVEHKLVDSKRRSRWHGNLLGSLQDHFIERAADAYVAWLRPKGARNRLAVAVSRNLRGAQRHYTFASGEGLAGRVWSTGIPAGHSNASPHPWWVFREGCENTTYICAPVGPPGGSAGVLSVGSDIGFDFASDDVAITSLYASTLLAASDSD